MNSKWKGYPIINNGIFWLHSNTSVSLLLPGSTYNINSGKSSMCPELFSVNKN